MPPASACERRPTSITPNPTIDLHLDAPTGCLLVCDLSEVLPQTPNEYAADGPKVHKSIRVPLCLGSMTFVLRVVLDNGQPWAFWGTRSWPTPKIEDAAAQPKVY